MAHPLHFPILKDIGLTETEAVIYELLLEKGPQRASDLVKPSGIGRGNVYNVLMQLQSKSLVIVKEGKHQTYEAVDPANLRSLLETKLKQAEHLEAVFNESLPTLSSAFNLSTGKPAIQIFEGLDGVAKVLDDSLTAEGEILTLVDPGAITPEVAKTEQDYIRKRVRAKIPKRVLMPDTPIARRWLLEEEPPFTTTRISKHLAGDFCTATEIYGNRVSILSFSQEKVISLLIEDRNMAEFFRVQFEALWKMSG